MSKPHLSRRNFLGGLVTIGSTIILGRMFSTMGTKKRVFATNKSSNSRVLGTSRRWGMLIDLKRCNGCGVCTKACIKHHQPQEDQEWIKVSQIKDQPTGKEYNFVRPCMNCQDAPCVKVCPVGASYYNEPNTVQIDNRICIGCRICMAACPYGARYFNWTKSNPPSSKQAIAEYTPDFANVHQKGTVEKCDYCVHLTREGTLPPCVQSCPTQALYYGNIAENAISNNEETLPLLETLQHKFGYRFKEELGTEPSVFYLPPRHD